jgi:hypothetical protein
MKSTSGTSAAQQYLNILRFPVACAFRNSVLGRHREVRIGSLTGAIHLPRPNLRELGKPFSELLPPCVRDIAFAKRIFNHGVSNDWEQLLWGKYFTYNLKDPANTAVASVRFVALTFRVRQPTGTRALSEVFEECLQYMPDWCARLTTWIEVLTKDDLDAAHPLPAALHPDPWTSAAWITSSRRKPRYDYFNAPLHSFGSDGRYAVTTELWSSALRGANTMSIPPEEYLLLRDARAAQWRDHGRRAVLDAATAVEIIIGPVLRAQLLKSHSGPETDTLLKREWRFSDRKKLMIKHGMWLPPNLQEQVMNLRNDVIHANAVINKSQAATAIELVGQLASHYAPLAPP